MVGEHARRESRLTREAHERRGWKADERRRVYRNGGDGPRRTQHRHPDGLAGDAKKVGHDEPQVEATATKKVRFVQCDDACGAWQLRQGR